MKILDVKPLLGSKERPWFNLFQLHVDRQSAAKWFAVEPHVAWVDGLGDADYWIIEFNCGLQVTFEFFHLGSGVFVYATEPVAQHVRRHLAHWRNELHEYPPEMFELFATKMPELTELTKFQLWRQGDDGNQVKVGYLTSELDAKCWQAELESHKHKQIYWVSRVD